MTQTLNLPTVTDLKDQARRLRSTLSRQGTDTTHSGALELLAGQYGYRDWNTLHAAAGNRSQRPPFEVGRVVTGKYLGQDFSGEIIALQALAQGEKFRVTIKFEEPVDVVTFDSFSAYRQRVTSTIDRTGRTMEKNSAGAFHMELDL